ncbi:MAG: prepilin-type N-terminal cleavage/methylation domain-containing protein [Candidatus Omnitrophica bacterium]|nr:prepilin-type N-terminal cleavage/methylation domain-containing protein [Candidatus Omnitrophota bacterium]
MLKKISARSAHKESGLSLVEVLITIAILAVVLFPIYEFLRQGALSWQIGENKTEVTQNARIGLDKMCNEIKHARAFYMLGSSQVRFWWKDLNDDELADANEIITYNWSGASGDDLTRKFDVEAEATPLANYVDSFEFKYYDILSAETAALDAVHFITATLRIKKTAQGFDYTAIMRKAVYPRNMNI